MKENTETPASHRQQLGKQGEDLAVTFLREKGYTILARNYRARHAEIDIICQKTAEVDADLVFVEVKTRAGSSHGSPIEAITQTKMAHVVRAARHYLYTHSIDDRQCRFDVIGIQFRAGVPQIEYLQDVVEY